VTHVCQYPGGEPMTWHKIVGLAAAVIGVVLISI
jgi:drug/metabolite transporter (DMT)-like permease